MRRLGLIVAATATIIGLAGTAAQAATMETVNLGTLSAPSELSLYGRISDCGCVYANGRDSGESQEWGRKTTGPGPGVRFDYDFSVSAPEEIDMRLWALTSAHLDRRDFTLTDLTTHRVVATSVMDHGFLELVALLNCSDLYRLGVSLPWAVRDTTILGIGATSPVPLPGALLLFYSGLAVLLGLSRVMWSRQSDLIRYSAGG